MEQHVVSADGYDAEQHGGEHPADGENEIGGTTAKRVGNRATGTAAGPNAPEAEEHVHDVMQRVHREEAEEHPRRHVHRRVSAAAGGEAESTDDEEEDSGYRGHQLDQPHR